MAATNVYLIFENQTEEAFLFYKDVFGTEFDGKMSRFSDAPQEEGAPELSESEKNLILHVTLPILGGLHLMGSDVPESRGMKVRKGNNVSISLHPDSKEEADRLFKELSKGGKVEMPMEDAFWGDYFGACTDKFGINWMVNYNNSNNSSY
jgi:PhnB protein